MYLSAIRLFLPVMILLLFTTTVLCDAQKPGFKCIYPFGALIYNCRLRCNIILPQNTLVNIDLSWHFSLTFSSLYDSVAIKVLHEGVASVRNVTSQHTDRPVWLVLNCETHVWFKMPVLPVFLRTIHGSLSLYLCNVSTDTFQLYLLFYGAKMYDLESDVLF